MSQSASVDGPAVDIRGLVMTYADTVAVDDLTMTVPRASVTAVLGPNGAGKTTTLETCEGYRTPQQGTVRVLGLDPVRQRRELLPRVGVMLQEGGAWSGVRAGEMLRHVASLHAHPLDPDLLSERLALHECGRTAYRRLSGGQRQRLGLAMALIGRPELVFVDEPTAGMDPAARRTTWELLEELRDDGVTVVLTTHYLEEAERIADLVHIIDHGRLVGSGSPRALTRDGTATIRLQTTSELPADAAATLSRQLGPEADVRATGSHTLTVTGTRGSGTITEVSQWCAVQGLTPDSLSMAQRSLEDVFLDLTGRELTS